MQDFTQLLVWQRAQSVAVAVHELTASMDVRRAPGLRSQLRRSAGSIAANIAEGSAYDSDRQFGRFVQMAIGSAAETRSNLDLAVRLRLIPRTKQQALDDELLQITRMLIALLKRLQSRDAARSAAESHS